MRKSFKKVLGVVLAASLVVSTPIAVQADAEETTFITESTSTAQTLSGTWYDAKDATAISTPVRATGDFEATFDVTVDSKGTGNEPPLIIVTDDHDLGSADGETFLSMRTDNWVQEGTKYDDGSGNHYGFVQDKNGCTANGWWYAETVDGVSYVGPSKDFWADVIPNIAGASVKYKVTRTGNSVKVFQSLQLKDSTEIYDQWQVIDVTGDNTIRLYVASWANTVTVNSINITYPEASVTVDNPTLDLVMNGVKTGKITPTAKMGNEVDTAATFAFESSDEEVATVDAEGNVTAVANGTATITTTSTSGTKTATATTKVTVTTDAKGVTIVSDALDGDGELTVNLLYDADKETYAAADPVALTAEVDPETASNKDIVWSVSGSAVTVTDDGKVAAATTAKDGDTAEVTATVKGTDISDTITVNVKVVDTKFVDATAVTVSPAAVTATAGEKVAFTASVTAGTEVPTDKTVTWTTDAGTITDAGVLTVPAEAKEGDVITVTAASNSNPEVKGTASVKVHLTETLTGTGWWGNHQTSKDRILKGNGSVSFIIEKSEPYSDAFGFCVEAYAVDENGNKAVYDGDLVDAADATVDEKGSYITVSYNGSYEGWVAGYPKSTTAKATPDMYSVEKSEVGYAAENVYQVTFTREDDDYLCLIKDLTNNEWFWTYVAKDVDMNSEYLGVHFMAQLGTYVLVDTTDHLTTDNTAKPVQVTPKPRATATPTPAADSSNSGSTATATATPTPAASATTTDSSSNSTLKAAKITVKKGKKAVKKVTVKKTKKVKLKISTTSDAKVKLKKLSKKQKKIAKVTLKGKKLTIKGKKKGKITLKLTTAKTSTYKKATKKIKVVVK